MSIKILLADDHKIMRAGLRSLLEKEHDMTVVAEASQGRTAVRLAREHAPDIVIIDITMPDLNGVEASHQILSETPGIKVVALSMHSDEQFVAGMLKAGASGYLLKDCAAEELCHAIRAVMAGETYLSPKIASIVVDDYRRDLSRDELERVTELTSREKEVLQLVAEGESNKRIASILGVSIKTVEHHKHNIRQKLRLETTAELTRYAIKRGLITV